MPKHLKNENASTLPQKIVKDQNAGILKLKCKYLITKIKVF
jgi:hypothetical protein